LKRIQYWNRIFRAYILRDTSQLTFWHGTPLLNPDFNNNKIDYYYMSFHEKANYDGPHDDNGIPMLDYRGHIGLQYNPIAIAQWGLGNYNLWRKTNENMYYDKFVKSSEWLLDNLTVNAFGRYVWMHHFDWEYRDTLISPWYSGLAQGQGLSVLVRAHMVLKDKKYLIAANAVYESFNFSIENGGVTYIDSNGEKWIEEYIVHPPTHILNGFIWGLWGVYDYAVHYKNDNAFSLFNEFNMTIRNNLKSYDIHYWSLYEHSGTLLKMVASSFYHKLHVTQLYVMYKLTGDLVYKKYGKKWELYSENRLFKIISLIHKIFFKLLYY